MPAASPLAGAHGFSSSSGEGAAGSTWKIKLGVGAAACGVMQYFYGSAEDFYDHRFITKKNPEDLTDFYGTEDFMEIFCVFPFMVSFMMRASSFDEAGVCHAYGLPGKMEVSMDFTEGPENDTVAMFNKRESFLDASAIFPGVVYWDMVQNFGYHRKKDGTCEVYHHGEHYRGPFPIRILFTVHAKYVAWATEKHVNSPSFGAEDDEGEEQEERQRRDIPLYVFKEFLHTLKEDVLKARAHHSAKQLCVKGHDETISALTRLAESEGHSACCHVTQKQKGKKTSRTLQLEIEDPQAKRVIKDALAHLAEADGKVRTQRVFHDMLHHPDVHPTPEKSS